MRGTVRVHGSVEVVGADGRAHAVAGRQPQAALVFLALADRPVDREEIADLLWGDHLSDHWKGAVRGVMAKVRSALVAGGLPPEALQTVDGRARLDLPEGWETDVGRGRRHLDAAVAAQREARPEAVLGAARRAREAFGPGPFLPHADGDWVRSTRARIEADEREAATIEVRALLALGRAGEAARLAEAAVARDPLDEAAHHHLVTALVADDRRRDARRAFDRLARVLDEELGISPAEATAALVAAPPPPLPVATRGPAATRRPTTSPDDVAFVGRAAELAILRERWDEAATTGRPQLVVIEGPSGIGKTRLAERGADLLVPDHGHLLWGRCREGSGVAYEPIVEALADLAHRAPGVVDTTALASFLDGPTVTVRGQLFRAVAEVVADLARRPTLWVVDDLQWATEDTLHLLEVGLDGLTGPIVVIVTCRDDAPPPVHAALARAPRLVATTSVELTGFDEGDLLALLATDGTNRAGDHERARALLDRTSGHPLLVAEIARDGARRGIAIDSAHVPDSVRDWVGHRAAALPPDLGARLDLAATIGLDVDLDLLVRCSADGPEVVLDQCEALVQAGLLVETGEGHFSFPHLVTHEVVYDRIGPTRRTLLHRRVAAALETTPDRPGVASERARHHALAGPAARGAAARHGLAAGRESLARSAWALADGQLAAAAEHADGDPGLRAEILVERARALHGGWDLDGAAALLAEAQDLARAHQRPDVLAEAVLLLVGRAGRGVALDLPDVERAALLREALAALGPDADADPSRHGLLGQLEVELALVLLLTDAADERAGLARRPLARARAAARTAPDDLARALLGARLAKLHPAQVHERLADLDEVLALPSGAVAPELLVRALTYRHEDRLVVGDRAGAVEDLARSRALADHYTHPYWQWAGRTWVALGHLVDGDLDRAEAEATTAAALQAGAAGEAGACFGVNLVAIRCYQGRAEEVVDLVAGAIEAFPQVPCYRAVLALVCAEAGDEDRAATELAHFAASGFANLPDDTNRPLGLAVLADAAVRLGAVGAATALVPLLEPYRGQHIVLNCYGGGGSYWGPASHHLAALAAVAGRPDAPERFVEAEADARRLGAAVVLPRITADRDRLLTARP